jgi:hypothetical protein
MEFKTGRVYLFRPCAVSYPVKDKYAVCVSGAHNLFYLINSVRNPVPPYAHQLKRGGVVYIEPFMIQSNTSRDVLSYRSFIDACEVRCIRDENYTDCRDLGIISPVLWLSIKQSARQKLPKHYSSIIAEEKI